MVSRAYRYCGSLILACVFFSAAAFAGLDSTPLLLQNEFLDVQFGAIGLQSFNDHALQKSFAVVDNTFSLTIDNHEILTRSLHSPEIKKELDAIEYTFHAFPYRIQVIYELKAGWHFVSKRILVSTESGNRQFRVNHIQVLGGEISEHIAGVFVPHSFWTRVSKKVNDYALFARLKDRTGIYMLVQNPFLSVKSEGEQFAISYSPEMDWDESNGPFESDRACIGAYRLSGHMVSTEIIPEWKWEPQEAGNAEAGEDQAEIEAFMDCVRAFVLPHPGPTVKIDVGWTENDYQIDVATVEGREEYKRIIDRSAEIGCDYILYAPSDTSLALTRNDTDSWHWEHVLWLGLGQKIRRGEWNPESDPIPPEVTEMLNYAKAKNVKLVAYAYPVLPFTQNPNWLVREKYDFANLGYRSLQDFLIKTLLTFYRRTGIGGYAFDYTFLSLPGPSEYSQWWGWRRVMEAIRSAEPDMVIDGRQAYQHYGPWIWLAGSYPHPTSTDEQPESFVPFPDLHFDRVSADRERYTAYRYRVRDFNPPELMPGYMTHQTPRNDFQGKLVSEPFRRRDWDYLGWKYSLFSSIATGGLNNVVDMIPARDPEEFKNFSQEDIAFFKHWLGWTDQNRAYLENTRFILGEPAVGRVDGTTAILGDRGYIFLFNPNGRPLTAHLKLDDSIGLSGGKDFVISELYPLEGFKFGKPDSGVWSYGDRFSLPLEGVTALVLRIEPSGAMAKEPVIFNVQGGVNFSEGKLTLTGVRGEPGSSTTALVVLPEFQKVGSVSVNGKDFRFTQEGNRVSIFIRFPGERFSHMQQVGEFEPQFAGGPFRGQFKIPARIFEQLRARARAWPIPWTLDDFKTPWLAPQRLLLFAQIAEPEDTMPVKLWLDGKHFELKKGYSSVRPHSPSFVGFYADVSELEPGREYRVRMDLPPLRRGQFQGLFFENVETEYTDQVEQ